MGPALLRRPVSGLLTLGLAALPGAAAAQLPNQSFELLPQHARATVGDTVLLQFRLRLDQGDLLYDTIPQPVSALPDGVRLLSVEKLHRAADRSMIGRAVVVFFRPGRQAVPVFGLPFMRSVKGLTRGTIVSDSAFVEIVPVAPPGNPELKDIRETLDRPRLDWWPVVGALAAAGAAGVELLRRRQRPRGASAPAPPALAPRPTVPDPYEQARARLQDIERSGPAADGEVGRRYAAVVDTLRAYLDEAHGIPAPMRTTGELVPTLPPALTRAGLGTRFATLLTEADLVKFARARPDAAAAEEVVHRALLLLEEWHAHSYHPLERPA
jgi:hypothetical protein